MMSEVMFAIVHSTRVVFLYEATLIDIMVMHLHLSLNKRILLSTCVYMGSFHHHEQGQDIRGCQRV